MFSLDVGHYFVFFPNLWTDTAIFLALLASSHTEAISPVAISPSNKSIYHLWDYRIAPGWELLKKWICFVHKWVIYCFIAWWYSNRRYCFCVRARLLNYFFTFNILLVHPSILLEACIRQRVVQVLCSGERRGRASWSKSCMSLVLLTSF